MKKFAAIALASAALCTPVLASITFYEAPGFRGRAFTIDKEVRNFERFGFNDRASSVIVDRGRWEVCTDARFEGNCVVLRRGNYGSLQDMGLDNAISSARPLVGQSRWQEAPPPPVAPVYEYRRRPTERIYEVEVTSVRAVVGPPEQRCWVEPESVTRREPDVGGAIVGGIIGGVLGHQIGGGRGKDVATAGGAVAGAAIGSGIAGGSTYSGNVRRCENVGSAAPAFYDVAYVFRGIEHHVQMSTPPGRTITVNERGEPRG